MSHLWQLCDIPPDVAAAEATALTQLSAGPGGWRTAADLYSLRSLTSFPVESRCLSDCAWAAKLRVANTSIQDHKTLSEQLVWARLGTQFPARAAAWSDWYASHFASVVGSAKCRASSMGLQASDNQHSIYDSIRALQACPNRIEARFRHKLARWQLSVPLGRLARRAPNIFQRLSRLVPPRVMAAVWRTQWNGWCTARRFQHVGLCALGCSHSARDCIEHYACCPLVVRLCRRYLGLQGVNLESFLCLGTAGDKELSLAALATYAVFRATNHFRGKPVPDAQTCSDALEHWCKTGAAGHASLTRAFDHRWQRPSFRR